MQICLNCHQELKSEHWLCSLCQWAPQKIKDFLSFAPSLALENDGFNAKDFEFLAQNEAKHFWFSARNRLITWAFKKYFPEAQNFLEIGCGTGFVLSSIKHQFPSLTIMGSDLHVRSLPYAKTRIHDTGSLFQMDARHMPFKDHFDVIGAFDVLEHIHEDERVIRQLYHSLKQGGGLILTVPQHPSLWSAADEVACHVRRYAILELQDKLKRCGFKILYTTSFVFFLLPLMFQSRRIDKKNYSPQKELMISPSLNFVLGIIMNIELLLLKLGLRFPVGGTRFIVAKKV